jgi:cysteine desulfurase
MRYLFCPYNLAIFGDCFFYRYVFEMMKVYFDNAASTPMDPQVAEQMLPYLSGYIGNPSSTHAHGRALRGVIESARRTIAECLECTPGEICFTSGGTEADNTVLRGTVAGQGIQHIISTPIEHHAVTHTIEQLEAEGKVKAHWLSVDAEGHIDLQELESLLKDGPSSLVSLMHGNNEIGTLHDLQAIGELCQEHNALFHSDTVQTMGHFRYNMKESPLHFAAASAHKFYGPKGVGFMYVKNGQKLPGLILGGGQERNQRAGTENVACIAGMAFALKKCYDKLDEKEAHLRSLKSYMIQQLNAHLPKVQYNGCLDADKSLATVLNVAPPCGEQDAMLTFRMDLAGISASGGSACNSGANQGSHVLRALGHPASRTQNSIRFSFGPQNTREEVDYAVQQLKEVVDSLIPA